MQQIDVPATPQAPPRARVVLVLDPNIAALLRQTIPAQCRSAWVGELIRNALAGFRADGAADHE